MQIIQFYFNKVYSIFSITKYIEEIRVINVINNWHPIFYRI